MTKRLKQRLSAYISPKELVKIRNAFATTVGITCAICEWNADNEEELKPEYLHRLTKQSGYCRFCNIIRGKKKGLKRCRENEFQLVKWVLTNAHESTRPAYRCVTQA
jgi:ligand-binding sensor protein